MSLIRPTFLIVCVGKKTTKHKSILSEIGKKETVLKSITRNWCAEWISHQFLKFFRGKCFS